MPQRPSVDIDIYIDGVLAGDEWQLVSTGESAGADRLDIATLEYNGAVLEDLSVAAFNGLEVEVVRNQTGAVWHWGKIGVVPMLLSSSSGETLTFVSRAELFHLGTRVDGYWINNPVAADVVLIDGDL